MTNSVVGALGDFTSSVSSIATSLVQSIFALFQAFFALLQDVASSVLQLVETFVKLGIDLFQGVAGFVMANFFVIALVGGGYYFYTTRQQQGKGGKKLRA